ncbi:MAG: hypothetical protein NZ773_16015 [Dehalococcoidia bacterium]|nr:hypothetical protein [Dehalococcoidia bacterium]
MSNQSGFISPQAHIGFFSVNSTVEWRSAYRGLHAGMNAASADKIAVLLHKTRAASEGVAQRLRGADAPPFIGQLPLHPEERSAAVERLRLFRDPFSALCQLLKHQPPLALALIAGEVAGQGDDTLENHSVFPHIARLLGPAKQDLSNDEREQLVRAFRDAALRLGLTVQPERRPGDLQWRVNELVLQGGARRAHARTLAEAFHRTERAIGLPDPGDTAACVRFCRATAERVPNTPRLRMILENDQTGWHAALYARLRRGDPVGESRIGPELAKELQGLATQSVSETRRRPELVLRGLDLCIHVPPGGPVTIHDGSRELIVPGGDFVVRTPWPDAIRWRWGETSWQTIGDWLGAADICAAFEAESGRFLRAVRPGERLEVSPGGIALLSRRGFNVDGQPADVILGGVHIAWVAVEQSQAMLDFPGAGTATISPRPERRILLGPQVARDAKGVVLLGATAVAAISVPGEAGARLGAQLWLRHPALPREGKRLDVTLDDGGLAQVPVGKLLPQSGPVGRLQAALTLPREERALVAASALYWPGLERFDGRRFHGPAPTNLLEAGCRGIHLSPEGISIAGDGDRPEALIALDTATLRFTAPGVYAALEPPGVPPESATPLPAGTTITLGGNLAWTLRVACDNPNAVLEVGQHTDAQAFARTSIRRISFGSLLRALDEGDGEVRVRYLGPADPPLTVCRLARAETPARFEIGLRSDFFELELAMKKPVASLRLECSELLSGRTEMLEVALDAQPDAAAVTPNERAATLVRCDPSNGQAAYRLRVPFADLGDGVWLLEPYCRAEGMPGHRPLRSAVDERYAFAFLNRGGVREDRLDTIAIPDPESAFRRAARALAISLADEVAEAAEPIEALYRAAGERLLEEAPHRAAAAFADDLAGIEAAGVAPGTLPRAAPWQISLRAFSLPASAYDPHADDKPELAAFGGLAVLGHTPTLKAVFASSRFDALFASGFENFSLANRVQAIDLTDFSFARLKQAFASCSHACGGDPPTLLGPDFFAHAAKRTLVNLAEARANPSNGNRLGEALYVAACGRTAASMLLKEARRLAKDVDGFRQPFPWLPGGSDADDEEMPRDLPPFLSALALAARLEVRRPGSLRAICDKIAAAVASAEGTSMPPEAGIGICTRVGYPLFAAHLLFWEVLLRSREE